ncbi:hypothetical protein [Streptomyces sp. NPDC001876]|uniref:hypothetical protein n=1 Tax=Streptomyces sp. NPDC001876 TaxID=3154402 RepID=UPI0033310FAF
MNAGRGHGEQLCSGPHFFPGYGGGVLSVLLANLRGMGNFGGSLAIGSAAELRDLLKATGFIGVEDTDVLAEGWQVSEFADADERSLPGLVEKAGAPAVMVSFLDSDVGFVEAVTPDGTAWTGLLNRGMAESYDIPLEDFPVETAVAGALAWSAAAGLTSEAEAVRQALTGSATFAEELYGLLLVGLGIPGARSAA